MFPANTRAVILSAESKEPYLQRAAQQTVLSENTKRRKTGN